MQGLKKVLLSGFVCSFSCFYSFFHHFLSHLESQGWLGTLKHQHYHSATRHPRQSHHSLWEQGGVIQITPSRSSRSPSTFTPESSTYTLRKHLAEQTDSGNYVPITPPRQQHKYNKHVINPANKIIPRVRLLHLPSLTHLPAPLSKSFNHSLCHLESWDIAAATVLRGYRETLFTGVCKENWDFGMKWVVMGSILQDAGSGLDPAKHLSTWLSLKKVEQLFH